MSASRPHTDTRIHGFKDVSASIVPVDLDRVPEVDTLLGRLGLGTFVRESITAPPGRNDSWIGTTTTGREVFVKKLLGEGGEVRGRMARLLEFENMSADLGLGPTVPSPRHLGSDPDRRLVVYDVVGHARSGAQLAAESEFDDERSADAGRLIGRLHALTPGRELDCSPLRRPSIDDLRGLPMAAFCNASSGELETWRLMQNDAQLVVAINELRDAERLAPKVPSHCDLRLDQFLVAGDTLHLSDWEEFRLADAARDIGSYAGEWLYRSVLNIVAVRDEGDDLVGGRSLTHEVVLRRGVQNMRRLLPRVRRFWEGYRQIRPAVEPGLAARATAFAGWHLFDRLAADAARVSRLSGIAKAAAGVGRAALISPEKFVETLGFGEPI
jgi:hypothetical protein